MGKGLVGWIKGQWDGEGASAPLCSLIPVPNPSLSHPCSSPGPPRRCPGNTWLPGCRDAAPENFPAVPAPAASAAATSSSSVAPCGQGPGCITGICHRDHLTSHIPVLGTPWGSPGLEALGQAHQGEEQEQLHVGSSRKMCLQSRPRSLYPGSGVWPEAPIRKANCSWDGYQNALKEDRGGMSSWGIPYSWGNSDHGCVGMGGKHSRLFCGSWCECRVVCPLNPLIPCWRV